jgi:hypothetical protein
MKFAFLLSLFVALFFSIAGPVSGSVPFHHHRKDTAGKKTVSFGKRPTYGKAANGRQVRANSAHQMPAHPLPMTRNFNQPRNPRSKVRRITTHR